MMIDSYWKNAAIGLSLVTALGVSAPAIADHVPVNPPDLFVGPAKPGEVPTDPARKGNSAPQSLVEAERQLKKEQDEADALAMEEALRAANQLPTTGEKRSERLDTLFDVLKNAKSERLASRAEDAIQRTWARSESDTINLLMGWASEAMEEKQYGKALDFLDNIIRLKPDFSEGWNRRATIYYLQKDFGRSIADVERTLELEPRHFGALSGLGFMLRQMGDDEQALFALKKALEINPTMKQVKSTIKSIEKELKDREI